MAGFWARCGLLSGGQARFRRGHLNTPLPRSHSTTSYLVFSTSSSLARSSTNLITAWRSLGFPMLRKARISRTPSSASGREDAGSLVREEGEAAADIEPVHAVIRRAIGQSTDLEISPRTLPSRNNCDLQSLHNPHALSEALTFAPT